MSLDPELLQDGEQLSPEEQDELKAFLEALLRGPANPEAGATPSLKELLLAPEPLSDAFAQAGPPVSLTSRTLVSFD